MLKEFILILNNLLRRKACTSEYMVSTFFEDIKVSDSSGKDNGNNL